MMVVERIFAVIGVLALACILIVATVVNLWGKKDPDEVLSPYEDENWSVPDPIEDDNEG